MFLVKFVSTIWNQMWRILLEKQGIKKIKQEYNILFKQYEKHLLHVGETELNIRSALDETELNEWRPTHKVRKSYQVHSGGGRSHY